MRIRPIVLWTIAVAAFALMMYQCALPGDLPADVDNEAGIAGTYNVNGVDPLGVEYSGTVVMTPTTDVDRFDVEWIVTGGIHRGIGTLDGNRFTVVWEATASGGGTGGGTAEYTVEDDGRLVGTKSVSGFEPAGTEEIFPTAQDDSSSR